MSKLLIHEEPLILLPGLAKRIGLNEAIILQQLHYWLEKSTNRRDGYVWVYNSYAQWQKQFPWWSIDTIKRTILHLEELELVISGNYNALKMDKTKWYRINTSALESLETTQTAEQDDPTMGANCTDDDGGLPRAIPETTTETTTVEEREEPNSTHRLNKGIAYLDTLSPSEAQALEEKFRLENQTILREAEKAADYARQVGVSRYKDYPSFFRNWLRRGLERGDLKPIPEKTADQLRYEEWERGLTRG